MKIKDTIELIRAAVRPVITMTLVSGYLYFNFQVTPLYEWLMVGSVVWYFGDRTYFKRKQFSQFLEVSNVQKTGRS